jgi:hypothetical protein
LGAAESESWQLDESMGGAGGSSEWELSARRQVGGLADVLRSQMEAQEFGISPRLSMDSEGRSELKELIQAEMEAHEFGISPLRQQTHASLSSDSRSGYYAPLLADVESGKSLG